jgi:hypothetical protein
MAVDKETANWRLFGGGAIAIAGLMWSIGLVLVQAGVTAFSPWLSIVALVVLALGFVLVAFGQTGSNGAVGTSVLGKIALVVYAATWLLMAIGRAISLGDAITTVAIVLVISSGFLSAIVIFRAAVARGAARWILFLPVIVGSVASLGLWLPVIAGQWWVWLVLAVLFLATGMLYLFNSRRIG